MTTKTTKLSVFAFLGLSFVAYGQYDGKVGINEPQPKATLEITPNTANKSTTASTVEGILIPRVSRLRAANMGTGVTESTLLYIDSVSDGTASGTTVNVDATGFYFFKGGVWVKMGAGATGAVTLQSLTGGIRKVVQANDTEWKKEGTFCLIQTTTATIDMPNPANYAGKILSVNNQSGTQLNYGGSYQPISATTLDGGKGHILMSDGSAWYVIGGSY
ncbi:hypothetical protein OKE68_06615 [Riemerella anatipestifer]|uniref:Uncharacterized protein n=1 Tax=Riemerella anatipestifer TaxID=34085 RepID=A0AAP3ALH4_RIEAN|nr:hypothetical protein [Riemerella anatipestifer]AZZ58094.1 hypothetical protein AWB57_03000 [Riemerella anatipestifer]MCW0511340.1 hypothetical protein [Riemerella anatipestifer]MCW0519814.1 hypothetical protein [Riemerella anatipestifer]MCW0523981.1 hypothetical protein [Riemerella anatipestifer]MDR7796896.1 hypothetical protein [Riemerella anatipestifer]